MLQFSFRSFGQAANHENEQQTETEAVDPLLGSMLIHKCISHVQPSAE